MRRSVVIGRATSPPRRPSSSEEAEAASRVSVVIPAYNVARYLADAIRSVLAQTYRDREVIVVDDGSTDGTADVVRAFGPAVTLIRQPNGGVSRARDRGAAEARGGILAFLDGDDEWLPRKLEVQLARLDARPEAVASFVGSMWVDERTGSTRRIPYHVEPDMARALAYGPILGNASSVAMRRSAFEAAGGFDPALSQSADWDMWLRLAQQGPLDYLDEPLVRIRVRERSMSSDVALLERDVRRVLAKFFASPERARDRDLRARVYAAHLLTLSGSHLATGDLLSSLRCLGAAVLRHPPGAVHALGTPARRIRRRLLGNGSAGSAR